VILKNKLISGFGLLKTGPLGPLEFSLLNIIN